MGVVIILAVLLVAPESLEPDLEIGRLLRVFMSLDVALGLVSFALLFVRRRRPLGVAVVTTVLGSTISLSALGAMMVAITSYAALTYPPERRTRRMLSFGTLGVLSFVGTFANSVLNEYSGISSTLGDDEPLSSRAVGWFAIQSAVTTVLIVGLCLAIGSYMRARRDLLAELRERAVRAEAVLDAESARARSAERTRIAREMHDVLAHRISLVALHSGALSLRTDLPPKDVREAAEVITSNAQLALTELRQVLGVLRAGSGEDDSGHLERPQPTLAQVDDLLDDARAVGTRVRVQVIGIGSLAPDGAAGDEAGVGGEGGVGGHAAARFAGTSVADALTTLSPTVSRTAYRILQEALTNARKHAPDAVVDVELSGRLGKVLTLAVTNPMAFASRAGRAEAGPRAAGAPDGAGPRATGETGTDRTAGERGVSASGLVGAGTGLAGLAERADLAGGTLDHGVEPDGFGRTIFAVRAWLPWDETVGGWRGRSGG
ncbi:putative two-component system sensor kinase [Actinomycetales bacterium JB111]|nr:putative two-component system sensor kinase [Actinomycetales bacterium JB111]